MSYDKAMKWFWNNLGKFSLAEIKLLQTDVDENWNNFEIILFHI